MTRRVKNLHKIYCYEKSTLFMLLDIEAQMFNTIFISCSKNNNR